MKTLSTTLKFKIRFSEIDAMRVVWHGAYAKYFEDAREYFGQQFDLGYLLIEQEGYFAPIVDLQFQYKQPLRYAMEPEITITYRPTEAAKIVFDYEIRDTATQAVMVTGRSVQVFMDKDYQLVWDTPAFYQAWKERWALI
ncbi:MAG: acyl-CoA thioesterase [Prevotella sp.]|nr:acyl-CoA thioesterase [Prevotella sp.]